MLKLAKAVLGVVLLYGLCVAAEARGKGEMDQAWDAYEELLETDGTTYVKARDALLRSTPDLQLRLAPYLVSSSWERRTLACILQGWATQGALYRQVQEQLESVDIQRLQGTAAGVTQIWDVFADRASSEYGEAILPLCWEALLKTRDTAPQWRTITFLHMVAAVPIEASVEPVLAHLEQSEDFGSKDLAARVLQLLPPERVKEVVGDRLQILDKEVRGNRDDRSWQISLLLRDILRRLGGFPDGG